MLRFQVLNGNSAGASWITRRFPVRIGRAASADIRLEDPGIWDEHLQIHLQPDRSLEVVVAENALATLNGQPVRKSSLHNGDILELGALQIRFGLSPAPQRSVRTRELLTWAAIGLLSFGQIALIYLLG